MDTVMITLSEQLAKLQDTAQSYLEALSTPAQLLCGLFAFVYIGYRLWSTWAKGQQIDFYGMIKPFAIGLVIVFFSAFTSLLNVVVYPLELATSQLANTLTMDYAQSQQNYEQTETHVRNAMAAYERDYGNELTTVEAESSLASQQLNTYQTTLQILCNLAQMVLTGVVLFIKVYVVLAKLVLMLVGPFAFALSLLPGFDTTLSKWVSHYVRILMYVPLCCIVSSLVAVLFATCLYPTLVNLFATLPTSGYNLVQYQQASSCQLTAHFFTLLFHGIAIALYACIPTFAKWIISSNLIRK